MPSLPNDTTAPVCVIAGVGPGNGAALARTFADAGHAVALLARRTGHIASLAATLPAARAYTCDLGDPGDVDRTFTHIAEDMGEVDTLIHNAGKGVWGAIDEIDEDTFVSTWKTGVFGLFLAARKVIPGMRSRGRGNVLVIGATASRRGVAGTAALAPAKSGQRALTESMARHLWPAGIHVASLILDGAVDGPSARARAAARPGKHFIDPDAVAAAALQLTRQPRSAWSFEIDLRPFDEPW